jgi:hypothetical protein
MILITKGQNGEEGEIGDAERTGENWLEHDESMADEEITYRCHRSRVGVIHYSLTPFPFQLLRISLLQPKLAPTPEEHQLLVGMSPPLSL